MYKLGFVAILCYQYRRATLTEVVGEPARVCMAHCGLCSAQIMGNSQLLGTLHYIILMLVFNVLYWHPLQ